MTFDPIDLLFTSGVVYVIESYLNRLKNLKFNIFFKKLVGQGHEKGQGCLILPKVNCKPSIHVSNLSFID